MTTDYFDAGVKVKKSRLLIIKSLYTLLPDLSADTSKKTLQYNTLL